MTWSDLQVVLPLPPSANELWIVSHGTIRSSQVLRDFNEAAGQKLQALVDLHRLKPLRGPVETIGTFFVPTLASDGPNREKALHDVLQGFAYENDRQIGQWCFRKDFTGLTDDDQGGLVRFTVSELNHPRLAKRLADAAARPKRPRKMPDQKKIDRYVIEGESLPDRIRRIAKPAVYRPPGVTVFRVNYDGPDPIEESFKPYAAGDRVLPTGRHGLYCPMGGCTGCAP